MTKKKISFLLLSLLLCTVFFFGCGTQQMDAPSTEQTSAPVSTPNPTPEPTSGQPTQKPTPEPTPEPPKPVYANMIAEGSYDIEVDSSSSMFRPVKAVLTVENGVMNVCMTMSGQGYGFLYMGTGEEALTASEDAYIPFVLDEEGAKTFTVPVDALNVDTDCAAWSIRKEKWYDRVLVFQSDLIPAAAIVEE